MRSPNRGNSILDSVVFSDRGKMPISIADAKKWMRIEGNNEDDVVDRLIEGVIDEFMTITNTSLVSHTITAIYTEYGKEIKLPYSPVSAITSVTLLNEGEETATDDYYLQGDTLFMKNLENTGLKVVYTSAGIFPNGLKDAVFQALLTNYNDREDNVLGGVTKIPNNSRKKALRYKRY